MFAYFDVAGNCSVYPDDVTPDYPGTRVDLSEEDLERLQDDKGRLQPARWVQDEDGKVVFRTEW